LTKQQSAPAKELTVPFSTHLLRVIVLGIVLAVLVAAISTTIQAPLGQRPVEGIEITKPPWYFLWLFLAEETFGVRAIVYVWTGLFIALLLLPFIDRSASRKWRDRKLILAAGTLILVAIILLTIYGVLRPAEQHLEEIVTGILEQQRTFWARFEIWAWLTAAVSARFRSLQGLAAENRT